VDIKTNTSQLNLSLGIITTTRTVLNTSIRMVYPFLAIFAAGLNVSVSQVSLAMAISMATAAIGPFVAPIADRHGRRAGMLIGLGIFLLGTLLAGLWPGYPTFFLVILLGNLGNNIFVPAIQAYLSDRTPYKKRGLYIAISELSWALAFILFVPLAGLIIDKVTWYAPFWVLSGLAALMIVLVLLFIPNDADQTRASEEVPMFADFKKVLTYTPALLGMLMGLLIIVGNEVVNVVYGVWIKDSFGLQIAALGAASAVIGFSELAGEGITAFLADHLGKEKTIFIGLAASSLFVLTLPWLGGSVVGVMIWLFLFYFTFEVVIISALPMMSEVMPQARATMMALFIAALSMGRALGDVLGPWLYQGGFWVNAIACIVLNILAGVILTRIKIPLQSDPK
jgi:predicted MFS family arabinose efflux permease